MAYKIEILVNVGKTIFITGMFEIHAGGHERPCVIVECIAGCEVRLVDF